MLLEGGGGHVRGGPDPLTVTAASTAPPILLENLIQGEVKNGQIAVEER